MGKWRELAERLEAHDNSDVSANRPPSVAIVTNVTDLPLFLRKGLDRLRTMPAPKVHDVGAWRQAVDDALALAEGGWASRALALGWEPLDLFGAVTDRNGYPDADGLAVWLGGRSIRTISETYASVGDGLDRAFFNRSNRLGETLLWEIGR